jgi:hypothetical protein
VSKVSKWNRAAIKFCVKLKETTTEMLKSSYSEEFYQEQVCLNGIIGSKKGKRHYKMMNRKAVIELLTIDHFHILVCQPVGYLWKIN